jgi:hypothetical protein
LIKFNLIRREEDTPSCIVPAEGRLVTQKTQIPEKRQEGGFNRKPKMEEEAGFSLFYAAAPL